jgi:hypothetical protein
MDQDVERRIRDRAYAIWEEEGCPEGRDAEHWMKACEEVAAEDGKDIRRQAGSGDDAAYQASNGNSEAGDAGRQDAGPQDAGPQDAYPQDSDPGAEKPRRTRTTRTAGKDAAAKNGGKPAAKGRRSAESG